MFGWGLLLGVVLALAAVAAYYYFVFKKKGTGDGGGTPGPAPDGDFEALVGFVTGMHHVFWAPYGHPDGLLDDSCNNVWRAAGLEEKGFPWHQVKK